MRRRLAVEVPAEDVAAEIEKTYAALGRAAKVPGFRPGRVPRPVLERHLRNEIVEGVREALSERKKEVMVSHA